MKKEISQMRPKNQVLWFPLLHTSSTKREFIIRSLCPEIISRMGKSNPTSDRLIEGGTTTPEPTCNPLIAYQRATMMHGYIESERREASI